MSFTSLIIMLFLISLLVLVHEWGHYVTARMFGVKVSRFGIGMPIGPTLFKTKRGDLEIVIHACLLGGYVSFPDDEEDSEKSLPKDSPERLINQPKWKRAIIISAGVIMNVVFAFLLIVFTALVFHKLPTGKADVFVNDLIKEGAIAQGYKDTIKKDDKIIKVNGLDIDSTYKFIFLIKNSAEYDNKIDKEIAEKNYNEILKLNPSLKENEKIKAGTLIKLPKRTLENPLIVSDEVAKGLDKYENSEIELTKEEITLRDKIKDSLNFKTDEEITLNELANSISDTYKPIDITVNRNGEILDFKDIKVPSDGVLGIKLSSSDIYQETKDIKSIIYYSYDYLIRSTKYMCYGLWQLITGKIPAKEMHGIIAITKIGSDIIQYQGMLNALLLTALISMNLAIINLLPIPALDGGHLMFIIIEKIIGKPLNEEAIDKISKFFFLLLIILMVLILFNDVWALITGKF